MASDASSCDVTVQAFAGKIHVERSRLRIEGRPGSSPDSLVEQFFEFQNQFGLGERIYASFERLRPQTQRLELAFTYPYILQLPFGVDLKFNQYRRESAGSFLG